MEQVLTRLRLFLPQARPFLPHVSALVFFAFLGWMNAYFQTSKVVDNPNLKDTWSIPNWSPYHAGAQRAQFAALDIWDGKKPQTVAKPDAAAKKAWQLVGTVRTGKTYAAVILLGSDGRVRRMMPGDDLPNGEKILAVGNGSLQIDASGEQQEVRLFQPEKIQPQKK